MTALLKGNGALSSMQLKAKAKEEARPFDELPINNGGRPSMRQGCSKVVPGG